MRIVARWSRSLAALALVSLSVIQPACGNVAGSQAIPSVVSVENCGLLFTDNNAGVSGTDTGYSLSIGHNTLWFFGDVFLLQPNLPNKRYVGNVSNCALLVPRGSGPAPLHHYTFLTDPGAGMARQVIPLEAGEDQKTRLWPVGGWYDESNERAYEFYTKVTIVSPGPFGFKVDGTGLASADTSKAASIEFTRLPAPSGGKLWWKDSDGPIFGSAVVQGETDGYLYIVGVLDRAGHKTAKLARVSASKIGDLASYVYYTGSSPGPKWSAHAEDAADIEGLTDFPTELSISYNAHLGGYLAVHSVGIFTDKVRLCLANDPWGPYHTIGEISTPHLLFTDGFTYAGKEHPELAQDHGRIVYITYVDNRRYWLELVKVTLKR